MQRRLRGLESPKYWRFGYRRWVLCVGLTELQVRRVDVGDIHSGRLFVMTSLKETLKSDLTVAMKASDDLTKSTLRMALSAITNAEVAGDEVVELSDDQIVKVLQAESKKRLESAEIYEQNGRAEAAAKEKAEAEVLAKYLPAAMSDSELAAVVAQKWRLRLLLETRE